MPAVSKGGLQSTPPLIRALFTICGNPVLSTPNGRQTDRALESLDLMVSMDIYINETTRHADFILPPPVGLEVDHYDLVFHGLAVRNTAKYSPATFTPDDSTPLDWQILSELARRIHPRGGGFAGFKARLKSRFMRWLTPAGILDLGLKLGPYGAWRSPKKWKTGLTLKRLQKNPHGIDLGPLQSQLPNCLRMPGGKIDLAPDVFAERFRHVVRTFSEQGCNALGSDESAGAFQLIGRRNVRSNNSWMHNSERLTRGKQLCTLLMNPHNWDSKIVSAL